MFRSCFDRCCSQEPGNRWRFFLTCLRVCDLMSQPLCVCVCVCHPPLSCLFLAQGCFSQTRHLLVSCVSSPQHIPSLLFPLTILFLQHPCHYLLQDEARKGSLFVRRGGTEFYAFAPGKPLLRRFRKWAYNKNWAKRYLKPAKNKKIKK